MDFKWADPKNPKKTARYYKTLILKISSECCSSLFLLHVMCVHLCG